MKLFFTSVSGPQPGGWHKTFKCKIYFIINQLKLFVFNQIH